ncbi:hypothetical protein C3L57_08670, partial [Veillonellaceae bacterium M2-8]|nr:hypothetical protein [Veillonellaceae bacterium M2-8]
HLSDALKQLRAERISKAENEKLVLPEGLEDEPTVERRWINAAKAHIRAGMPRAQAEARAWASIGRTPPPKLEAHSRSVRPQLRRA